MPKLSLPQICVLPASPPDLVDIAAAAGFDQVGFRLEPATAEDWQFPMRAGSPMMRQTIERLNATGLSVLDVEVFRLISKMSFERYHFVFEACAEVGGRELLATCDIKDENEAIDVVSKASEVAARYGLFINLEFMTWLAVDNLSVAKRIISKANQPNAAILIDTLHVHRSRVPLEEVRSLDRKLLRYLQLCDAPVPPPDFETMLFQARFERLMPGDGVIPLASYLEALPSDLPISVEVPNRARLKEIGPLAVAQQAMTKTRMLLSAVES